MYLVEGNGCQREGREEAIVEAEETKFVPRQILARDIHTTCSRVSTVGLLIRENYPFKCDLRRPYSRLRLHCYRRWLSFLILSLSSSGQGYLSRSSREVVIAVKLEPRAPTSFFTPKNPYWWIELSLLCCVDL